MPCRGGSKSSSRSSSCSCTHLNEQLADFFGNIGGRQGNFTSLGQLDRNLCEAHTAASRRMLMSVWVDG